MAPAIGVTTRPAGSCPGQRMNRGERTPPSSVLPLRPFIPPFQRELFGPLSERKTTSVSRARPRSSSRRRTRPTLSSRFSIIASAQRAWSRSSCAGWVPCRASDRPRNLAQYFSGTAQGECGVVKGT